MTNHEFYPLTLDRWADFERLFGPRGACAGCWCMYWKLPRKEFNAGQGDGNRLAQKAILASGRTPGLLAYVNGVAAGWCALEPRENYPGLARSRILKPVDETSVWSVTCFFVDRRYRRQGLTVALLRAVVDYVKEQGGKVVEGYPVEPRPGQKISPSFIYTGMASTFRQAGFVEVARRSETRPIMRYYLK
ncbi:MAG: GNAT family N-acetyltransferase [Chloroflexi bacterium]|nr:GNAT family N-acetyltransferase [Chloroflexota bacterium]